MPKPKVVNKPRHVNMYIDETVHAALIRISATRQLSTGVVCTVSDLVREALDKFVKEETK